MSKVFVTQESGRHNLSRALEYGDIEVLTDSDFPLFRDGSQVTERMSSKLSYFIPDKDFLLLIGDPIIIGLAFGILARRGVKILKVLKWDGQATRYIPVNVSL